MSLLSWLVIQNLTDILYLGLCVYQCFAVLSCVALRFSDRALIDVAFTFLSQYLFSIALPAIYTTKGNISKYLSQDSQLFCCYFNFVIDIVLLLDRVRVSRWFVLP